MTRGSEHAAATCRRHRRAIAERRRHQRSLAPSRRRARRGCECTTWWRVRAGEQREDARRGPRGGPPWRARGRRLRRIVAREAPRIENNPPHTHPRRPRATRQVVQALSSCSHSGIRLLARAGPAGLGDQAQHFGEPVGRATYGVAADANRERN